MTDTKQYKNASLIFCGNVNVLHLSISVSGRRMALHCIYTFICSVASLFSVRGFIMIDYMYYSPVLWFVVQPVTVYLTLSLFRRLKKR